MMFLLVLSPLVALGLMLALQALETRVLEAGASGHRPRSRQPDRRSPGRPRTVASVR
jgi:hypothetical protein